jgi:hypothetical protein
MAHNLDGKPGWGDRRAVPVVGGWSLMVTSKIALGRFGDGRVEPLKQVLNDLSYLSKFSRFI